MDCMKIKKVLSSKKDIKVTPWSAKTFRPHWLSSYRQKQLKSKNIVYVCNNMEV